MEIGHRDRGGYREANAPAQKSCQTISTWKPPQLGSDHNGRTDADQSSDDCSGEQPRLPCTVAQDGPHDSAEPCEDPGSDE